MKPSGKPNQKVTGRWFSLVIGDFIFFWNGTRKKIKPGHGRMCVQQILLHFSTSGLSLWLCEEANLSENVAFISGGASSAPVKFTDFYFCLESNFYCF